jgi:flavin-dependent dehydrogenase
MFPKQIAIVGGGPAGAFAAEQVARAGREVTLFDEKLAWEKPCGGGLTDKAIVRWPFLREAGVERNSITACELIAPSGLRTSFRLDRPIAIFSRLTLNGLLLERARNAGAALIRERIVSIEGRSGNWILKSSSAEHRAEFILLAAGARNPFRGQPAPAFGADDFMVAVGYYIPGTRQTVQVQFLQGLHGYLWVFPRLDHFSVGICGRMQGQSTAELRRRLEALLPNLGLSTEGARFYAHIIPSLTEASLRRSALCGNGWAVAGDAAGFVDPITGEGLYYALRSGELFARAVMNDMPESYAELVKRDFLPELERAARIAGRFYSGQWMGDSVIERMVQLTARSPRFRDLMRDLFAGVQEYSTLRNRLYKSLPKIAAEALVSTLWQAESSSPGSSSLGIG